MQTIPDALEWRPPASPLSPPLAVENCHGFGVSRHNRFRPPAARLDRRAVHDIAPQWGWQKWEISRGQGGSIDIDHLQPMSFLMEGTPREKSTFSTSEAAEAIPRRHKDVRQVALA